MIYLHQIKFVNIQTSLLQKTKITTKKKKTKLAKGMNIVHKKIKTSSLSQTLWRKRWKEACECH
jgi:hypothetical protein